MALGIRRGFHRRRGITLIETMAASLILTVSLTGTIAAFFAVSTMSNRMSQSSVAISVARRRVEEVRNLGYANTTDGTTTTYSDLNGNDTTTSSAYRYVTTVAISTSTTETDAKLHLKTVVVTVKRTSDNMVLETTGTYLAYGGI